TANSGCSATDVVLTAPVTVDNCKVDSVSKDYSSTTFPVGITKVKWTVTDVCGNTATCIQTVTVTDNQKPTLISCANPVNVTSDNGACFASNVNLGTPPAFSDNCTTNDSTLKDYSSTTFPVGITKVKWTIKDVSGNTTTCTQIVTVTDDQKPTLISCAQPVNITAD